MAYGAAYPKTDTLSSRLDRQRGQLQYPLQLQDIRFELALALLEGALYSLRTQPRRKKECRMACPLERILGKEEGYLWSWD